MFSLKTTFLKWRPDYEVAADEYSKAGNKKFYCLVIYISYIYIYN